MIGVEGKSTSQIGDNNYHVGFDDGIKSGNLAGLVRTPELPDLYQK